MSTIGVTQYEGVDRAIYIGEQLLDVQRVVGPGEFKSWLEANFRGSPSMAYRYMRLARNRDVVQNHGTINEALAALPALSTGRPPRTRASVAEWLMIFLYEANDSAAVRAKTVLEAAEDEGISVKTLRRAAEDMEIVKTPRGGGPNCVWSLPDCIRQPMDEANAAEG